MISVVSTVAYQVLNPELPFKTRLEIKRCELIGHIYSFRGDITLAALQWEQVFSSRSLTAHISVTNVLKRKRGAGLLHRPLEKSIAGRSAFPDSLQILRTDWWVWCSYVTFEKSVISFGEKQLYIETHDVPSCFAAALMMVIMEVKSPVAELRC